MRQTNVTEKPTPAAAVDYTTFFYSGLRTISSHVRSISTPIIITSTTQTSHALSLRSSIRSRFWKHSGDPESETTVPFTKEPAPAVSEERTPASQNIWTMKGVPLRLGLPRFPSFDSASRPVPLDPHAPSPASTSRSLFIDFSETTSSRDSSPSTSDVEFRKDDSLLHISSTSLPYLTPLSGRPLSVQTMPLPSCRSFAFSPIDQRETIDDLWIRGLDLESPSESHYGRLDVLPQSAIDTEVSHWDTDREDYDWRQFHTGLVRGDTEIPFSPTIADIS